MRFVTVVLFSSTRVRALILMHALAVALQFFAAGKSHQVRFMCYNQQPV
jgi:hypothetical protein